MRASAPPEWLEARLARERKRVDRALVRALDGLAGALPAALLEPLGHGVLSGGKRIRPILLLAAHRACGGPDSDSACDLAAAVELIHAYSLMHDDLPCMDDADLRRGRPTSHRLYGEIHTMWAAAALIPAAALRAWTAAGALGCPEGVRRALIRELCRAAGAEGMVAGQVLDLLGEDRDLDEAALDTLHQRKTGALLAASLRMGALAAGAPPDARAALERYGAAIGLAFQIADDVLDATATARELGKNPSDDALGKSTYVSLYGVDEAARRARARAEKARAALRAGSVDAPLLDALADWIVERGR